MLIPNNKKVQTQKSALFFILTQLSFKNSYFTHHKGCVSSSRLGKVCKHPLLSFRSVG